MSFSIDYSTVARCRPEHIWLAIQDIRRWPQFDRDAIESVRWVSGEPWKKGSRFEIKVRKPISYTLRPEIVEAEEPILIHWKGKGSGIIGEQWFIFKILPDGNNTELRTLQEYSGAPLLLLGQRGKSVIEQGVHHVLDHIKKEAEANARVANWAPPCV
jgi:hypothetical protein